MNKTFSFSNFVVFQSPPNFHAILKWFEDPILWIAYGGSLTNELIITNYDYGESIYKFLMYCYDKSHAH
jgi:hypothetical protein